MTTGHDQMWRDASKILQGMLNPELFNRWFAPIKPLETKDGTLVLGVANEFHQIWLQDNFLPLIREAVNQTTSHPVQVRFAVTPGKEGAIDTVMKPLGTLRTASIKLEKDSKLNPRYTFDTFVVGPNSNFAHAAALAVSQSPAKAYNPLFLYGGVGLGKTHLMQAIGHAVSREAKVSRVCYLTCEQFTNDFIQAIQNSTLVKFRKKYRQVDVLLIDDVQFLADKERMQEEFFHTFNTLFDAHKQIVLSSDRPAGEIANLETRLVSRFEWGLVTELQPPALETRIAILKKKAALIDVKLSDQVIEFLAEKIRTNIRRLEGALVRVASYASLTGKEITRDALESLLRDALHEEARRTITVEAIQKKVAEHFDIRLADMTSRRRPQSVAFPRQIAMYLSRTLTDRSLANIGESFGGRDHGTVLHACRLIEKQVAKDARLRQTVSYIEQVLQRQ
ncbi:MAG TPA: chromosomal replication initiator protein DnaA [Verrucomicrobiae bacterium]|nr:chromosomal replication initiator protein DnaA [Verrucomicrobiae bacterium]